MQVSAVSWLFLPDHCEDVYFCDTKVVCNGDGLDTCTKLAVDCESGCFYAFHTYLQEGEGCNRNTVYSCEMPVAFFRYSKQLAIGLLLT